jgi:hypothetical protein
LEHLAYESPFDEMFLWVVDRHGCEHTPALAGWRVIEVIREWGLDLNGGVVVHGLSCFMWANPGPHISSV